MTSRNGLEVWSDLGLRGSIRSRSNFRTYPRKALYPTPGTRRRAYSEHYWVERIRNQPSHQVNGGWKYSSTTIVIPTLLGSRWRDLLRLT